MRTWGWTCLAVLLAAIVWGCDLENRRTPPVAKAGNPSAVWLAAGMTALPPSETDNLSGTSGLERFGADRLDRTYDLVTPPDTHFSFNLVVRCDASFSDSRIAVGHVKDGDAVPSGGPESLAAAGLRVEGYQLTASGNMLEGRGFQNTRVIVSGSIGVEQHLLLRAVSFTTGRVDIGVRIRLGAESAINLGYDDFATARPGVLRKLIHSAEGVYNGLPAIAASEGRFSIISYGSHWLPRENGVTRFGPTLRSSMQWDAGTHVVTGGASDMLAERTLEIRNHEIASRGRVVAVVTHTSTAHVIVDISTDGGAKFPLRFEAPRVVPVEPRERVLSLVISPDYVISCFFWRRVQLTEQGAQSSQFMYYEGLPTGFDANGTPTGYTFGLPVTLESFDFVVAPLVMGAESSSGGDLVAGYGYFLTPEQVGGEDPEPTWVYGIATRRASESDFIFGEVARMTLPPPPPPPPSPSPPEPQPLPPPPPGYHCPQVCVVGTGPTMQVFYALDHPVGVRLFHSNDAGESFSQVELADTANARLPKVHARWKDGALRVDLLFLRDTPQGDIQLNEVHGLLWEDFSSQAAPLAYRLTTATSQPAGGGALLTQSVTPAGFDSDLDGDRIVVVTHEVVRQTGEQTQFVPMETLEEILPKPVMQAYLPAPGLGFRNLYRIFLLD
jgi:hypothetical protein